jgi:SLT domain-containing protein/phage-related protein
VSEGLYGGQLAIDVVSDTSGFGRDLQEKVDAAAARVKAKIQATIDSAKAEAQLKAITARKYVTDLKVEVAGAEAEAKLDAIAAKKRKTELSVQVAEKKAEAELAVLTRKRTTEIEVKINEASAKALSFGGGFASLMKFPAIGAAIAPVVGLVDQLATGLGSVVSAAGPAVGVLGGIPGAVAGLAQGIGVIKIATSGVSTAYKLITKDQAALDAAQSKGAAGAKEAAAAQAKLAGDLQLLSPPMRLLITMVDKGLMPAFQGIKNSVTDALVVPMQDAIIAIVPLLGTLQRELTGTAQIMGGALQNLSQQYLATPLFQSQFATIMRTNNTAFGTLATAITPVARALTTLVVASGPMLERFAHAVANTAISVSNFITQKGVGGANSPLAQFFQIAGDRAALLGHIVATLAEALVRMFAQGDEAGKGLLQSLSDVTDKFLAWTKSASGQNAIKKYFDDSAPALREVGSLLLDVTKFIVGLGQGGGFGPFISQLRTEVLPIIEQILTGLQGSFGPQLIHALTQVLEIVNTIVGSGGGGLSGFVGVIDAVATALNTLLSLPGVGPFVSSLLTMAGAAAGISLVGGGLLKLVAPITSIIGATPKVVQFTQGLLGIGKGATDAAGAAGTLGQKISGIVSTSWGAVSSGVGTAAGAIGRAASAAGEWALQMAKATGAAVAGAVRAVGAAVAEAAASMGRAAVAAGAWALQQARAAAAGAAGAIRAIAAAAAEAAVQFGTAALAAGAWVLAQARSLATTVASTAAMVAVRAATIAWTAVQWLLNAALNANPISIVVIALAALVAAIIYAWKNNEDFRNRVLAAWAAVKAAATAVWGWLVTYIPQVWDTIKNAAINTWNAITAFFNTTWTTIRAIFNTALALLVTLITTQYNVMHTIATTVWNAVVAFFTTTWNAIRTIFNTVLAAIVLVVTTQYNVMRTVTTTVWNAISAFFTTIWGAIKTVFTTILAAILTIVTTQYNAMRTAATTIWNAISSYFTTIWGAIKTVFTTILAAILTIVTTQYNAMRTAATTIWNAISSFFTTIWGTIKTTVSNAVTTLASTLSGAWTGMRNTAQTIWTGIQTTIQNVLNGMQTAFRNAVSAIGTIWNGLRAAAQAPVTFVVNTVYNNGIRRAWNAVAGLVGLNQLPAITMAVGGLVPGGYTPGRDSVPALLSPGEGVLVPEAVRGIAGALGTSASNAVQMINAAYSSRVSGPSGFSLGGIVGGVQHFADGGVVGNIIGGITGGIGSLANAVIGSIGSAFRAVVEPLKNAMAGGNLWSQGVKAMFSKLIDAAIEKITGADQKKLEALVASAGPSGGGNVTRWTPVVLQALGMLGLPSSLLPTVLAQINSESGGNPNIIQQIHDVNSGGNEARGLMQVIPPTFAAYHVAGTSNNIFDPLANIAAGLNYASHRYGGAAGIAAVLGHGHGYDNGGVFPDGTVGWNTSGAPEAVLTNREWGTLQQLVASASTSRAGLAAIPQQQRPDAPPVNINVYPQPGQDEREIARQVAVELGWQLR